MGHLSHFSTVVALVSVAWWKCRRRCCDRCREVVRDVNGVLRTTALPSLKINGVNAHKACTRVKTERGNIHGSVTSYILKCYPCDQSQSESDPDESSFWRRVRVLRDLLGVLEWRGSLPNGDASCERELIESRPFYAHQTQVPITNACSS